MFLKQKIVFYDGDCGFCNKSVQLILLHEKGESIHFAALQSSFAKIFFESKNYPQPDLSTFYYFDGKELHERSKAALKLIKNLKWYFQFLLIGWLLPKKVRDGLYNFIARRRRRLAKGFCVIPNEKQKKRFLS